MSDINMKPFLYAKANIEGRPILDEGCVSLDPSMLYIDDDLTEKIVPVYTGPQIASMLQNLSDALDALMPFALHGKALFGNRDAVGGYLGAVYSSGSSHLCAGAFAEAMRLCGKTGCQPSEQPSADKKGKT